MYTHSGNAYRELQFLHTSFGNTCSHRAQHHWRSAHTQLKLLGSVQHLRSYLLVASTMEEGLVAKDLVTDVRSPPARFVTLVRMERSDEAGYVHGTPLR